ncbi:Stage II sporulation protein E (SpoIIE) [compost metagenome]
MGRLTSLQPSAYPLGVRQNTKFPVRTASIAEGDLLVFYSDGIIEARNPEGEEFGFERFEQAIWLHQKHSADTIKTSILAELAAFQQGIRQDDDITLVVVQFNPVQHHAAPAESGSSKATV